MAVPVLIGLLLSAGACDFGDDPVGPGTGIDLEVVRGPLHPVEREGDVNVAPVAGAVGVVQPVGEDGTMSVSTGSSGTARLRLRPGSYRVAVATCPGALHLPDAQEPVRVAAAALTPVAFECDTGIR